jgi:hypothetical protein
MREKLNPKERWPLGFALKPSILSAGVQHLVTPGKGGKIPCRG